MNNQQIFLGETPIHQSQVEVKGGFVQLQGEKFYKISGYNRMPDFFMSIVSITDHWMFISSNGALTAGRKDRNNALFPYYCVDKIHDQYDISGSKTLALVAKNNKKYLWEPFSKKTEGVYAIERNLYKSIFGNKIIFEEVNIDLGLTFQYGWYFSDTFGFVKKSVLLNQSKQELTVEMLDGMQNILPYGSHYSFQLEYSNLSDAYKKNERVVETNLGLFILSSIPVDRAEPSEALKANTVWEAGLENPTILLSSIQLERFKQGLPLTSETDIRATRGAYFVNKTLTVPANSQKEWMLVAEINQDAGQVALLNQQLLSRNDLKNQVNADINADTVKLRNIVAKADGLQLTNEELSYARHYANTLFNIMRGGIFINNYSVDKADFTDYLSKINIPLFQRMQGWLSDLPQHLESSQLVQMAEKLGDTDLIRICNEYLPLTFSRRHGDPSRPWNQFSIEVQNTDGPVKSDYQGNWRDIFQNWEALAHSYPGFTEQMITKFVDASTADGYNPYRITRNGIDWERPDPHDPWAFIGYWGDHQIIYLQKLLELSHRFNPGKIQQMLAKEYFVYANVPYRIKPYEQIVKTPQDTILFDYDLDKKIGQKAAAFGADGKLLFQSDSQLYKVNLTEKMLVSLLTKFSNFIPEAGIWLNTQRPEWNDANNALVGNGVSMVTLYYMRRSLSFWVSIFKEIKTDEYQISEEVKQLFNAVHKCFDENQNLLDNGFTDSNRRTIADSLGKAGSNYRETIYNHSFSGKKQKVTAQHLIDFCELGLRYIDQSIDANKRADGLYHAYNLISITNDRISIRYLYEMLEGQVSVLSSGYLSAAESLKVLDALKASSLFRADQYSYLLYPDRQLHRFTQKNNLPVEAVKKSVLLTKMAEQKDTSIIHQDIHGNYHFNGTFRNAQGLLDALDKLDKNRYQSEVEIEKAQLGKLFEDLFDHHSFTGRSGTFYGFEGLGSIYWHMVSKLLLAVQESYYRGMAEGADARILGRLKDHYYEIKAGIGLYKSPKLYGAFPTDAYSHTPGHAGAQQPGMTGQVKEDFLSRFGELGVIVADGVISFNASLLNHHEILTADAVFEYLSPDGNIHQLNLKSGQLAFTFCGVPFVYTIGSKSSVSVIVSNGEVIESDGNKLDELSSHKIFSRNGEIKQVTVGVVFN
ncbi:MAG: hypothetical protein WCX31_06460 [Salinivirgaceae bacterium]